MTRIRILSRAGAGLLAVFLGAAVAPAQDYPTRPVTLVVPFSPGGGNDIMARLVATVMSRTMGQQVVVENGPGAGGNIGSRQAAHSAPDG